MKKIHYIFAVLSLILVVSACKPQEPTPASTAINVNVVDKNNNTIPDADVYLFETKKAFDDFVSGISVGYVAYCKTDASGNVKFDNLKQIDSYYFYVEKGDVNNSESNYKMGILLKEAVTYSVKIQLKEFVTRSITFTSQSSSLNGNGISIELLGSTNGFTFSGVINSTTPAKVFTPTQNGTYTFYIKNQNGCVWQESVNFDGVNDVVVNLDPCNEQAFVFNTSNNQAGSIQLFLNNEAKAFDTIDANGGTSTVYRPIGTYTYRAVHSNGTCTWVGKTSSTVTLSDCQ
jgi:hypothetical protein